MHKVFLLLILFPTYLFAKPVDVYPFKTHQQTLLFQRLSNEFRCLVCQNQSIADSNAPLAIDLRRKIYFMVLAGDDEKNIVKYMTDRYGDFILYKPRLSLQTILLWGLPILLFILGGLYLARLGRRTGEAS